MSARHSRKGAKEVAGNVGKVSPIQKGLTGPPHGSVNLALALNRHARFPETLPSTASTHQQTTPVPSQEFQHHSDRYIHCVVGFSKFLTFLPITYTQNLR